VATRISRSGQKNGDTAGEGIAAVPPTAGIPSLAAMPG
jgi:hypothetical protein